MTTVSSFDEILKVGIKQRERGDYFESIQYFSLLLAEGGWTDSQLAMVYSHIGLARGLQRDWKSALMAYEEAYAYAMQSQNPGRIAETLRGLSVCHTNLGNDGLGFATMARDSAKLLKRKDIPWFTHGVILALISKKAPFMTMVGWIVMETFELFIAWFYEKSVLALFAWTMAMIKDWLYLIKRSVAPAFHLIGIKRA